MKKIFLKKAFIKRLLLFLFTALMVFAGGCSSLREEEDGKLKIVSTVFAAYDFARQVAGQNADVQLLLPPGTESHSFEPTPQDMADIENCDIFIYVGGESDSWAEQLISSGEGGACRIKLMDCVTPLTERVTEGMEPERGEEEEPGEFDEHVWTSPRNAGLISERIAEELKQLDPEHSEEYDAKLSAYIEKLDRLDADFRDIVKNGSRRTLVFGDRFPLRYFAEEYGLEYYAAFPGCSSQTEPSAATVAFLIDKVRQEKIPVVFCIELSNGLMADTICEDTGAVKRLFNTCHNVSKENFESGETYISLMKKNEAVLREALN